MELENVITHTFRVMCEREGGHFGHTVYRKKTRTNRYLHTDSSNPPAQIQAVISTSVQRSLGHPTQELQKLSLVLKSNIFPNRQFYRALDDRVSLIEKLGKEDGRTLT